MPNPFYLRARIDNLWRRSGEHNPGYIRVKALDAIVRELYARNERARLNRHMYFATDPFDVARHLLRDLHDRADSPVPASEASLGPPLPLGEGWGEGSPSCTEEESLEEDDDPL